MKTTESGGKNYPVLRRVTVPPLDVLYFVNNLVWDTPDGVWPSVPVTRFTPLDAWLGVRGEESKDQRQSYD